MKLHKGPEKVVEADIESEIQIWGERQLGPFLHGCSLCQFSRNSEALPGDLRCGADGRPPYSTSVVPADVFLFFRVKSTLKAIFQNIMCVKKNVTSEFSLVLLVVLDDL